MTAEFKEIGHCGGRIEIRIHMTEDGRSVRQMRWSSSRPNHFALLELYALPQGIPLETIRSVGMGQTQEPPSVPGSYHVVLGSDSEGRFGHHCPKCEGYWRSDRWGLTCPYCGVAGRGIDFLSEAQCMYVEHFCSALTEGLSKQEDVLIDLDAVAEAAATNSETPSFYRAEVSQQHKFRCPQCKAYNDILGKFGYCSFCGERNDLEILRSEIAGIRKAMHEHGDRPENTLRNAVSAFDSFVAQYAKQLARRVPLTQTRRNKLLKHRFHDIQDVRGTFTAYFDIDICKGMTAADQEFVANAFYRRHLYEHNGGEVDERYMRDSGAANIRLKQLLRESKEDVNKVCDAILHMGSALHVGFHELFPPRRQ